MVSALGLAALIAQAAAPVPVPMPRWQVSQQSFACALVTQRGVRALVVADFAGDQTRNYFGFAAQGDPWPGVVVFRNVRGARRVQQEGERFRFLFRGSRTGAQPSSFELTFSGGAGLQSEAEMRLVHRGDAAAGHCLAIPRVPPISEE